MRRAPCAEDSGIGVAERGSRADGVLVVLGEAAVAIEPGEGSLDDPAAWMDDEPGLIGEFADDLDDDRGGVRDTRAVVGAVSEGALDEGLPPPQIGRAHV